MAICRPEKSPIHPVLFEALSRAAIGRMEVPSFCRLRRCGREGFCEGKLETRAIPACFRGPQEVGALLPACMARADDVWFGEFLLTWILCHEDYFDLVRPPQAVRSLLALDECWPVFIYSAQEADVRSGEPTMSKRIEKMEVAYQNAMGEICNALEASRPELKGE